jgi:hypothetical protein
MQSPARIAVLVAFACASSAGAIGCLSNSSADVSHAGHDAGAPPDAGTPSTTGGSVGEDGGGASAAQAGAGFAVVSGGVKASSSAHVLVTSTGQAPGGNGSMHSAAHTIVGGLVGATQ